MCGIIDSFALDFGLVSLQSRTDQLFFIVYMMAAIMVYAGIRLIKEKRHRIELETHLTIMEKAMDEFRIIRHQYNNIFQSAVFHIENAQCHADQKFINEIMEKTSELNKNNVLQLVKIKNRQLRSCLFQMAELCKKNGIDFSMMVGGDVKHINMRESTLSHTLKIIFQHSFDMVMRFNKREIDIEIYSCSDGVSITFDIYFENAYSNYSRSEYSDNHLTQAIPNEAINKVITRNKNVIFNSHMDNNYYRQELMIM